MTGVGLCLKCKLLGEVPKKAEIGLESVNEWKIQITLARIAWNWAKRAARSPKRKVCDPGAALIPAKPKNPKENTPFYSIFLLFSVPGAQHIVIKGNSVGLAYVLGWNGLHTGAVFLTCWGLKNYILGDRLALRFG